MKSLILYDSMGGNTALVAETIEKALGARAMATDLVKVDKDLDIEMFDYDLIFIGSPVIDWLPTKLLMDFVKRKMKAYARQGAVKPSSPLLPGKFGVSFGTFAGPHIGEKEALPMTMWLNSFLEHLGYAALDQWLVVGRHHHNKEINRNGRLGNIEDRPNAVDLAVVEHKVGGLVDSLSAWCA